VVGNTSPHGGHVFAWIRTFFRRKRHLAIPLRDFQKLNKALTGDGLWTIPAKLAGQGNQRIADSSEIVRMVGLHFFPITCGSHRRYDYRTQGIQYNVEI
jgi:hypothetical protein